MVQIKRAYEESSKQDGYRVLVDRLWPRGIRKTSLPLDAWVKEIAPSTELRKRFGHDPDKWADFQREYRKELRRTDAQGWLEELASRARRGRVTLIYGAKDQEHNNAVVLSDLIQAKSTRTRSSQVRKAPSRARAAPARRAPGRIRKAA